ncbi:MAG: helix-turn-helix domain-containing protein [Anaerolineales bacterium]|jgi:transposase
MPKKIDFKLSESELSTIEKAIQKSESAHLVKRATGVRMLHQGYSPAEVAEILSVAQPTPYQWFHRFRAGGLAGLENQPRSGRPPIADEAYLAEIDTALEKEPGELGYEFALWTVQRLNQHLQRVTGKQISDERLRVLLKARGWVYRRPKEDLAHKQDAQARQAAEAFLAELKKQPAKTRSSSSSLWTKQP